jgi:hypothetical protein
MILRELASVERAIAWLRFNGPIMSNRQLHRVLFRVCTENCETFCACPDHINGLNLKGSCEKALGGRSRSMSESDVEQTNQAFPTAG